jgi:YVTN family beta-propeller protein
VFHCRLFGLALVASAALVPAALRAQAPYKIGVVSESGDIVTWLVPKDGKLAVDRTVPVGVMPADIDGPHNMVVAPDRKSYYISVAHGTPFGSLWRMDMASDTLLGRAPVEMFPTTISLTPDGELAFVANSDFYGDHPRINVVSIVSTPTMTKITDLPVCDMPHGVKVNHAGTRVYISCMDSDELVELDVATLAIARRAKTGGGMAGMGHTAMQHAAPAAGPGAAPGGGGADNNCQPTFVSASPDDRTLYVACNHTGTLQVWDAATLAMTKELPVGKGAYNVEPSPDGKLVIVTNKKDQSVSIVDAATLTELARVPTSKKVVHGVAYSPDGQYAYISCESIGADPGAVDMIDLATRKVVASIAVPAQPTGISIWRP